MGGFAATTGARDDDRAVSGDRSHCRGGGASESASSKGSTGQKATKGSAWSRAGNNKTKRDTGVEHLRKLGGAWVGGRTKWFSWLGAWHSGINSDAIYLTDPQPAWLLFYTWTCCAGPSGITGTIRSLPLKEIRP